MPIKHLLNWQNLCLLDMTALVSTSSNALVTPSLNPSIISVTIDQYLYSMSSQKYWSQVYKKIIKFQHPLISKTQFGCMKKRSCLIQVLASTSTTLYHNINKNNNSDSIFTDYSKEFHSVPHKKLLQKIWMRVIRGPLWFSFLSIFFKTRYTL